MEKVSINQDERQYEIAGIRQVEEHVLQIIFTGDVPDTWGDIVVYTAGDVQCANLPGYNTLYRDEGQTVYLSDDGSVYVPPQEPSEVSPPEPYEPTLEEIQVAKKREIAAACEQSIYAGINVTLTDGAVEHYSLTEHDQLNLFGKQIQVSAEQEQIEYHADGQPCRYYNAADMQTIIQAAMWHVSYHTTYCNAMNMWVAGCKSTEELAEVSYGADIPEKYRSEVLDAYLIEIAGMTEEGKDGTSVTE